MRPVTVEYVVSQYFAQMPTAGVVGNIGAKGTVAYYVALYGNYQPFGHAGMDFACPIGTRVYAMADGVVLYAGWGYNLPGTGPVRKWLLYANFPGIVTVIQHPGWIGVYAHLSNNDAAPVGTVVKMGQLIALSGNTGGVAAHLHVEALVDLSYKTGGGLIYGRTDPSKFFSGGLAAMGTTTQEEEDMGHVDTISDAAAKAIAVHVHGLQVKREGAEGTNTLGWSLGAEGQRTDGIISRTAQAAVAGVLFTKFPRQGTGQTGETDLASVISWFDHGLQHAGSDGAAAAGPGIDPAVVAEAIAAAVADSLARAAAAIRDGQ